jgi:hypothetical protein
VAGVRVRPGAELAYKTETLEAGLDVAVEFSRFNNSDYDSDDQDVEFTLNKSAERLTWGLSADFVRDSTRTSEADDSGRITDIVRGEQYSLAPYMEYWLSESFRWNASLSHSGKEFDDEASDTTYIGEIFGPEHLNTTAYAGYDYDQVSAGLIYLFNEDGYLGLTVTKSKYEGDPFVSFFSVFGFVGKRENSSESDAIDYSLSVNYRLTEKFSISGQVGYSDRDNAYRVTTYTNLGAVLPTQSAYVETSSSSEVVDISVDYKGEQHEFNGLLGISDSPSSDGVVVKNSNVKLSWLWRLSKLSELKNSIEYGEKETSDDSLEDGGRASGINRDYMNYRLRYSHRLTKEWFSHIEYRYRYNDRSTLDGTAESNVIALGFTYRPTKTTWSR